MLITETLNEAYKVKMVLNRFCMKISIINPEQPKETKKNQVHIFNIGHTELLIVPKQVAEKESIPVRDLLNVIVWDMPSSLASYREMAKLIEYENGSMLSFLPSSDTTPTDIVKKQMMKKYKKNLMVELPVKWKELEKIRTRVFDIYRAVTPKLIKTEKLNEVKKQILKSKKLKQYFSEHDDEKEILKGSIKSEQEKAHMFKHLDFLPDYCIPKSIIANPYEDVC
jgi:hypothetical protein